MASIKTNILPTTSKRYEIALEKHLNSVNYELDVQLKELQNCLAIEKTKKKNGQNDENAHKQLFEILNRKFQNEKSLFEDVEEKLAKIKKKQTDFNTKMEMWKKNLDEQRKMEKQVQNKVHLKNIDISKLQSTKNTSSALRDLDDSYTLKQSIIKTTKKLSNLYGEKKAQDEHLKQLKSDIKNAENELVQLAFLMESLKNDASKNDSKLQILKDSIKIYEKGNTEIKDHWESLIRKMDDEEKSMQDKKLNNGLSLNPLQKEITDISLKNIEHQAQIEKLESLNGVLNEKFKNFKENQKSSSEKNNENPLNKNIEMTNLEKVEEKLYSTNYQYENQKELLDQLKFLLRIKENFTRQNLKNVAHEDSQSNRKNSLLKPSSVQQKIKNKNLRNYHENRKTMVDLTRKISALKYRKERFEQEKTEIQNQHKEKEQEIQKLRKQLEDIEEKRLNLPKTDASISNEALSEEIETYEKQLNELKMRRKTLKNSIKNLKNEIEEFRKKCEEYKSKTGDFQTLEDIDRVSNQRASQIHMLKNSRQSMKREIQRIEKELEYVVLRRDHAVLGAKSAIGTKNELRRERTRKNEEMKHEIEELQQKIIQTRNRLNSYKSANKN